MTLVVRKSRPPQAHGTKMTAAERRLAGYVLAAFNDASAGTNLTGDLYLTGGSDKFVQSYVDALAASDNWVQFTALMADAAAAGAKNRPEHIAKASVAVATTFTLLDEHAIEWSGIHSAELIKYIQDQARANAQGFVSSSLNGVYTIQQLQRQLREFLVLTPGQVNSVTRAVEQLGHDLAQDGTMSQAAIRQSMSEYSSKLSEQKIKYRANLIARTELSNANNAGHMIGLANGISSGLVDPNTVKQWNTAEDERTCPICRPMDGVTVLWSEDFNLEGVTLPSPPAHGGCRCNFVELPPDYATSRGYTPIPSEMDIYGDEITPQAPWSGWKGVDLGELAHISEVVGSGFSEQAASSVVPELADASAQAADILSVVNAVTSAIGENFGQLTQPAQQAIASFAITRGLDWNVAEWAPQDRLEFQQKIERLNRAQ